MATTTGEVLIPASGVSTQIVAGVASSTVFLWVGEGEQSVFIGPAAVTTENGLPVPRGQVIGPISGINAINGIIGQNQSGRGATVRFMQIA